MSKLHVSNRDLQKIYELALASYKEGHIVGIAAHLQLISQVLLASGAIIDKCPEFELPTRLMCQPVDDE